MKQFLVFVLAILVAGFASAQRIVSPTEFIGEQYGKQFTPHHKLVDYFTELSSDPRVMLQQYGESNEGRPLYIAVITSPENQKNLESLRKKNLSLAHMDESSMSDEEALPFVWLSYSVHGNEAGGSESSMNVIYQLLSDPSFNELLQKVVVILDPSLNPDGYSRYSHWIRGTSGKSVHPSHSDVEHMEPWPGGRVNHYLFDLNRDWAWQTQVESQHRIKMYNMWMPHVHADLHEMGYDSHYYFAPAAEPYHKAITDYQRELQHEIGKSNAAVFDENSWLYFTREIFDLLYPSYGDTYPTFNGSVGMTYEQAGHSMAGRSIQMSNNRNLTLQDRIDHHTATSLETIKTAVREKSSIISNFKKYFDESVKTTGKPYAGYLVKQGVNIEAFKELMDRNGIEYSIRKIEEPASGHSYYENQQKYYTIDPGDVYVPAAQPKAVLLQVLMEKEPILADSVTYDITSWCIPYAYGLETYGMKSPLLEKAGDDSDFGLKAQKEKNSYATYFHWSKDMKSKEILGELLVNESLTVKQVIKPIKLNEVELRPGDIVVLKGDQHSDANYQKAVSIIEQLNPSTYGYIKSGFAIKGTDLGGSGLTKIEMPKVLTIFGDGVNANSYGQVWNYFENIIDFPISRVDISRLAYLDMSDFNTLILPDGYYSLNEAQKNKLKEWVRNGGKVISIAGANRNFQNDKGFALGNVERAQDLKKDSDKAAEERYKKRKYEGAERRSIAGSIPGAIFKTEIDKTHPMCYGIDQYYTLKNSSMSYPLLGGGAYNPVRIPSEYESYGFIGSKIKDRFHENAVVSVESMGSGQIIYMADNPLFRAFWKNGEALFANAIFQL